MEKLSPKIGIAMVDIHLGDDLPDGIEFVEEARALGHRSFVCMLTASDDTETLCEFHNCGYPNDKILGAALGMERGTVRQRLNRARERLGLENRYQLVSLLTVLSGYDARYRTARKGER